MKGVAVVRLKSFKDRRGEFVKLWEKDGWPEFVEDDISISKRNVLRGLHGDSITAKFITCLQGEVFLTILNPATREHKEIILSEENRFAVFIPPNRAVGYLILSERAVVFYKQSQKYGDADQFTLPWDKFGIPWPTKNPILSERDKNAY